MDNIVERLYRVTIIKANIKQYRAPFFQMLRDVLSSYGIDLTVIYSDSPDAERKKGDNVGLPPQLGKKVPRIYMRHNRILFQFPSMKDLIGSDLIIVVNANGYLLNYPLLLASSLGLQRVAFWGHGSNMQGNAASLSERFKRRLANATDWWFAYTREVADYLKLIGVSSKKITTIDNATDTKGFRNLVLSVTSAELEKVRSLLGIRKDDRLGLYCGSLYEGKRIPYLLKATEHILEIEPRFRLLVVGGGSQASLVKRVSKNNPAIVYAGPLFGRDKAICFKIAMLCLNPGSVGLGILDSFAAGLPFLTTAEALHGPEISYLENNRNGLMISGDEMVFAQNVVQLLRDPERTVFLQRGAEETASRYTLENMVQNVLDGILTCLKITG